MGQIPYKYFRSKTVVLAPLPPFFFFFLRMERQAWDYIWDIEEIVRFHLIRVSVIFVLFPVLIPFIGLGIQDFFPPSSGPVSPVVELVYS